MAKNDDDDFEDLEDEELEDDMDEAEEEVIKELLAQCDSIVLPYAEYGAIGASGAVLTALSSGTPTYVTDVCWFSEIPWLPRLHEENFLQSVISNIGNQVFEAQYRQNLEKFIESNNWLQVANYHLALYRELMGARI